MRWVAARAGVVLALAACGKRAATDVDGTLPERVTEVAVADPRAILEEAAAHLDPTPRAAALRHLIRLDPEPAGGTWGTRGLYDPSAWVQRAAVEALATRTSEPETVARLAEYARLGQADPYTRAEAALCLARAGATDLGEALGAAWRAETEPWVVAPLALAASAQGDPEALGAAAEALASGEIGLEPRFLEAVAATGHPELQQALQAAAGSVEEELALPVAVALVRLGDPSGEQALRRALDDPSDEVRLGAVDLLVDLDHDVATALLQRARADRSSLVRWYAELALAARGVGSADSFARAWAEPDREVRRLAVRFAARAASHPVAGAQRKVARAAEVVVPAALTDPDPTVRLEAVRAAGLLQMRGAIAPIADLTRDPWLDLRVDAAGVLLALQGGAP